MSASGLPDEAPELVVLSWRVQRAWMPWTHSRRSVLPIQIEGVVPMTVWLRFLDDIEVLIHYPKLAARVALGLTAGYLCMLIVGGTFLSLFALYLVLMAACAAVFYWTYPKVMEVGPVTAMRHEDAFRQAGCELEFGWSDSAPNGLPDKALWYAVRTPTVSWDVSVPYGQGSGSKIEAQAPDGRTVELIVPLGLKGGDVFKAYARPRRPAPLNTGARPPQPSDATDAVGTRAMPMQ